MMASRSSTPSARSPQSAHEPILGATSNVRVAIRVRPLNKRGPSSSRTNCKIDDRNRTERKMYSKHAYGLYMYNKTATHLPSQTREITLFPLVKSPSAINADLFAYETEKPCWNTCCWKTFLCCWFSQCGWGS